MRSIHKRADGLFLCAVTAVVFLAGCAWSGAGVHARLLPSSAAAFAAEEAPGAPTLTGIALREEEPLLLPTDVLLLPEDGERLPAGALLSRLPDGSDRRVERPCLYFSDCDGLERLKAPDAAALDVPAVEALLTAEPETSGNPRGRLVYDGAWWFAALAPEQLELPTDGACRLRFAEQGEWIPARLFAVSTAEDGQRALLFRLNRGGTLLSLRHTTAEIYIP